MSFVFSRDSIINLIENLIFQSWPKEMGSLKTPFQQLTYEEAMEIYGSDSPDLRIPGKVSSIVILSIHIIFLIQSYTNNFSFL